MHQEICLQMKISQENEKDSKSLKPCSRMVEFFQMITSISLSLLLPLGYLLLARLTTSHYQYSIEVNQLKNIEPLYFIALYTSHYILVGIIASGALIHVLTGRLTKTNHSIDTKGRDIESPRRCSYDGWIFLCVFQVCICFGIEGSISGDGDGVGFSEEKGFVRRVVFFLGLHETMRFWSEVVVKPVVGDNTERWIGKVALAGGFGMLWWRLKDEVEALVIVVEAKRLVGFNVGGADVAGWLLYYLTVFIGGVRVVKRVLWVGGVFCWRRRPEQNNGDICDDHGNV